MQVTHHYFHPCLALPDNPQPVETVTLSDLESGEVTMVTKKREEEKKTKLEEVAETEEPIVEM